MKFALCKFISIAGYSQGLFPKSPVFVKELLYLGAQGVVWSSALYPSHNITRTAENLHAPIEQLNCYARQLNLNFLL